MDPTENTLQADLELDISKAITVIKADNNAATKHLQQRLKLSYGRAAEILARLEKEGIVGPARGGQPRVIDFAKLNKAALSFSSALPSVVVPESSFSPVSDAKVSPPAQDRPPETLIPSADVSLPVQKRVEELRLGILAFLPPVRFNTAAFLENLKRNPPAHELVTFSDDKSFNPTVLMNEGKSIEQTFAGLKDRQHGFANLVFYTAFVCAWKRNFTHFLFLEADVRTRSRNGNYPDSLKWDELLLQRFTDAQSERSVELILGGTMMLENPFRSADPETARRATELLEKWNPNLASADARERNKPIACRARRGVKEKSAMVGCNGAGAIYSVAGLRTVLPEIREPGDTATIVTLAKDGLPYDWELAKRLWRTHKAKAFDYCAHLPDMFSSFADSVSTEEERLSMLRDGRVVLVHSIKSNVVE